MILFCGATQTHTTLQGEKLALTWKRPSCLPMGPHPSQGSVSA